MEWKQQEPTLGGASNSLQASAKSTAEHLCAGAVVLTSFQWFIDMLARSIYPLQNMMVRLTVMRRWDCGEITDAGFNSTHTCTTRAAILCACMHVHLGKPTTSLILEKLPEKTALQTTGPKLGVDKSRDFCASRSGRCKLRHKTEYQAAVHKKVRWHEHTCTMRSVSNRGGDERTIRRSRCL